ncbi:hypothetical protein [uncultured Shewanella sp.]|uniref:hypothetical protein n=1 Tax=uncultured Shewanella sp. TaxID=173975 RepID=UPI00260F821C|nr:hypothetical protein [uncultured Shewanella sp.]
MNNVINLPTQPTKSKTEKAIELIKDIFIPDSSDDPFEHYQHLFLLIFGLISIPAAIWFCINTLLTSSEAIISYQPAGKILNMTQTKESVRVETTKGIYFTKEVFNLSFDTEMIIIERNKLPIGLCDKSKIQCNSLL